MHQIYLLSILTFAVCLPSACLAFRPKLRGSKAAGFRKLSDNCSSIRGDDECIGTQGCLWDDIVGCVNIGGEYEYEYEPVDCRAVEDPELCDMRENCWWSNNQCIESLEYEDKCGVLSTMEDCAQDESCVWETDYCYLMEEYEVATPTLAPVENCTQYALSEDCINQDACLWIDEECLGLRNYTSAPNNTDYEVTVAPAVDCDEIATSAQCSEREYCVWYGEVCLDKEEFVWTQNSTEHPTTPGLSECGERITFSECDAQDDCFWDGLECHSIDYVDAPNATDDKTRSPIDDCSVHTSFADCDDQDDCFWDGLECYNIDEYTMAPNSTDDKTRSPIDDCSVHSSFADCDDQDDCFWDGLECYNIDEYIMAPNATDDKTRAPRPPSMKPTTAPTTYSNGTMSGSNASEVDFCVSFTNVTACEANSVCIWVEGNCLGEVEYNVGTQTGNETHTSVPTPDNNSDSFCESLHQKAECESTALCYWSESGKCSEDTTAMTEDGDLFLGN